MRTPSVYGGGDFAPRANDIVKRARERRCTEMKSSSVARFALLGLLAGRLWRERFYLDLDLLFGAGYEDE